MLKFDLKLQFSYILFYITGTATKRDLRPEDNVTFKERKYLQIVELKDQPPVNVIRQPKEYQREELLKLTIKEDQITKVTVATKCEQKVVPPSVSDATEDCPKLVPIVDKDGFQLYNPNEQQSDDDESMSVDGSSFDEYEEEDEVGSLGSEYTEIDSDDADSFLSEDINDKYLNKGSNNDDDYISSDEENYFLVAKFKVDVIDATSCTYKAGATTKNVDEEVEEDNRQAPPSQTLSKLVKVGSKANITSATVIDDMSEEEDSTNQSSNNEDISNESEDLPHNKNIIETSVEETSNDQMDDESTQQLNESVENETTIDSPELTDTEEQDKQTKESSQSTKTTAQQLTNYKTVFCNAINANIVLVLVKDPFYIYGTARLTLLAGTVEVYGHYLAKDKEVELFSPRGCSEIEVASKQTSAKETFSPDKIKNILQSYNSNFIKSDLEQIAQSFDPEKDAIVLLKRNEERKKLVQQFKKFMNENVFPNLQNITMDRPLYDSEYLLRCMINISPTEHKSLLVPENWHLLKVTDNSRVMFIGGKGVGKSTLLRFLINKHITQHEKMLLIDLDIGQPELFVPQTVSCSIVEKPLLGPGFFLNIQPEKSYAVGNTNIALCPHKYVEAVRSLIRFCLAQEKFQSIPWFINTMGYNKGFGPELIAVIASELPLTDMIQLHSNKGINNFDKILYPEVVAQMPRNMFVEDAENAPENAQKSWYQLYLWKSAVKTQSRYQKEWGMSAKDMRYAILLTRLSEALQGHAEWLSDCKPMR